MKSLLYEMEFVYKYIIPSASFSKSNQAIDIIDDVKNNYNKFLRIKSDIIKFHKSAETFKDLCRAQKSYETLMIIGEMADYTNDSL